MKKLLMTIMTGTLLTACGSDAVKTTDVPAGDSTAVATTPVVAEVMATSYNVSTTESVLNWKGSAVGKSHNGTVTVKSGAVQVEGTNVVGGTVVFDMATIVSLDLEGEYKGKLEGHLKAADFFNVDSFATATIVVKSVNAGNVTADLTIKNVTKSITFPAEVVVTETAVNVKATLTINRTDFGVVYGSGNFFDLAKDKAISDDIEFTVVVKATK
jgi:polyisoprenoid-binding protein YceI